MKFDSDPIFAAVVSLGLCGALAGCDDPFGPGRNVILGISELDAPAEVATETTKVVRIR